MKSVLTIAGSDPSGGAGIQADLKTMMSYKVYGMSVLTLLTAQNTKGVRSVFPLPPEFVGSQLDTIFTDIPPDAVKIGLLGNARIAEIVAEKLALYRPTHIVLDPVAASTSGTAFLDEELEEIMKKKLFPMAELVTPNIPEAKHYLHTSIGDNKDRADLGRCLCEEWKCAILIKGGHTETGSADDLLCSQTQEVWFPGKRIMAQNTHGTGCTLSTAIACGLAKGSSLEESIQNAKDYLAELLRLDIPLGHGNGPLHHCLSSRTLI